MLFPGDAFGAAAVPSPGRGSPRCGGIVRAFCGAGLLGARSVVRAGVDDDRALLAAGNRSATRASSQCSIPPRPMRSPAQPRTSGTPSAPSPFRYFRSRTSRPTWDTRTSRRRWYPLTTFRNRRGRAAQPTRRRSRIRAPPAGGFGTHSGQTAKADDATEAEIASDASLTADRERAEVLQSSIRSRCADQSVVRCSGAQSSGRPSWVSEAMTNSELA